MRSRSRRSRSSPRRSRKGSASRSRKLGRRSRAANVARLEHRGLWEEYWRGKSVAARNALVEALAGHAVGVARRILRRARAPGAPPRDVTADERSAVCVALARVVERYDPGKAALSTYLWHAVRGAVIDLWRKQGWFPKRLFRERGGAVRMMSVEQLRDDLGSGFPGDVDVSAATDERLPSALVDRDGISAMEGAVETRDQCERWLRLLSGLDELVIRRRYVEDVAFKEVAAELGVTRQRVSFVHRRALARIREHEEGRAG